MIAYTSQHLNNTQANWSTVEKEAYAIVHAVKTFYPYLYGRKFQVLTDHRPLQWLMTVKEPTGRLARWALLLQEFDIEITYRPGKTNQNADCLSRIPVNKIDDHPLSGEPVPIFFITRDFAAEQNKDSYCKNARNRVESANQRHAAVKEDQIVTDGLTNKELLSPSMDNPADRANQSEDDSDNDLDFVELYNGLIGTADGRILVPETFRPKILQRFHDSPYAGHLGTKKTIARIKRRYLWPKMTKEIKEYVRKCEICAKRKAVGSSRAPLKPMPPPDHVWQTMAMDIVGPVTESDEGYVYILVMSEYLTRYTVTAPMKDMTAETVAKVFIEKIVLQHGVPERVLTDQGTNFLSQLMDELYRQLGIERLRTTAYRPCCDGLVERFNRTLGDMLASYVSKTPNKWSDFLPYATFAYNTSVHASTGQTPFYLMFGREAREPNDVLPPSRLLLVTDENTIFAQMWHGAKEVAKEAIEAAQEKQKEYYDRKTKTVSYNEGDLVLLKEMQNTPGKFNMRWSGPYPVLEKKSEVNYKLEVEGKEYVTHVDRMKLFRKKVQKEADERKTGQLEAETANRPTEQKQRRKSKAKERLPQQTRYSLRKAITLPLKLRDYALGVK